jgi:hypothetical protein
MQLSFWLGVMGFGMLVCGRRAPQLEIPRRYGWLLGFYEMDLYNLLKMRPTFQHQNNPDYISEKS